MLDEFAEVNAYIHDPKTDNGQPGRIKRPVLLWTNSFMGLERMMTMIARYFIFHDDAPDAKRIPRAEAALRMWCGFADEDREESRLANQYEYLEQNYPWLDYWLVDYLRESVSSADEESMERVEIGIHELQKRRKRFEYSSLYKSPSVNDFKTIRYDKIIAQAISARGPFKRYYLVSRERDWEWCIHREKNARLKENQPDLILKTVAAYLLERERKLRHDDALRFEPVNLKSIAHWIVAGLRLDRTHYKEIKIGDRQLFNFENGVSGNVTKIKPDLEWFDMCRWSLIDGTEGDDLLDSYLDNYPDAIFYSDTGGAVQLQLNQRYSRY